MALGDGNVLVYDGENWAEVRITQPLYILRAHLGRVFLTSWTNFDGNMLLSVSNEPNVAVWDGEELLIRVQLPDKVRSPQPNWVDSDWNVPRVYVADVSPHIRVLTFPS
jgi:hypothetical protein